MILRIWSNKIIETLSNLKTKPFDVVLFDTIRPLVSNFLLNTREKKKVERQKRKNWTPRFMSKSV